MNEKKEFVFVVGVGEVNEEHSPEALFSNFQSAIIYAKKEYKLTSGFKLYKDATGVVISETMWVADIITLGKGYPDECFIERFELKK